ncbi:hypothetical protein Q8A64_15020 [Oxalobacteraceae bacterium R-40]|uniref:Uncharacterized protein n=1 Tax=Keguizhuia sedimenti TaxID=3064264 RepID=A0ABU1BUG7_9BURK|nr:hypothetical protein [Oxalobacteraceae bacterium R-40]
MSKQFNAKKFKGALTGAQHSKMAQSSRRMLFTHCDAPTEERGGWHADIVFGGGSATLLRYQRKYFLLTA